MKRPSLPARGVWIEINKKSAETLGFKSLPARGVWIEIGSFPQGFSSLVVTPRKGSVD